MKKTNNLSLPNPSSMKKEAKIKKVCFPPMENPCYVANNGFMSQWCCGCGLRHIWHFKIFERSVDKQESFIEISIMQDDKGTELRRHYEVSNSLTPRR